MRLHSRVLVRAVVFAALVSPVACDSRTTSGDGLCSLLGPCATGGNTPLDISYIVGFPDSLVSKDPANQVGVLSIGDSVVLRYVHPGPVPAGQYANAWACGSSALDGGSLRWAVSDSSARVIARPSAGTAVVRARAAGRFTVLTTPSLSPDTPQNVWVGGVVACPSGRSIFWINVAAK